jgi:hypothetical protein
MSKAEELIDRVEVFDDSYEIVEGLRDMALPLGARGYYPKEAAAHIEGLWVLAQDLAKELKKCQKPH